LPRSHVTMLTPHGDPLGRIGEPDIGGQCVYIRELSKHLSSHGIRVTAFTRDRADGKPAKEQFAEYATVVRVPCGPDGFVPKEEILPHLDAFADCVRRALEGGEVLHSHYWDGGYVASTLHSDQPWFHSTHSLGKIKMRSLPDGAKYQYEDRIRIEEDVYQGCDCVFALTQIEKEQIASLYNVPERQICIIPPGVDTEVFQPRGKASAHRQALGLPDKLTVLTLGRLDARKGLDLFVHAAGELASRDNLPPFSVVMSAGDGSESEAGEHAKILDLVEETELSTHLTWLPVVEESLLPQYYNAADIFVLPSRYEPFGIVMLEAMASGIPVVATSNGGPATVIEHGIDGLLGNPEETDKFSELIAALLYDDELRKSSGRAAYQKVVHEYSWDAIAARFADAYRQPRGGA